MCTSNPYSTQPKIDKGDFPDPFSPPNGPQVSSASDWAKASAIWRDLILQLEYGGLPPAPDSVECEVIHRGRVNAWEGKPRLESHRIHCHGGEKPFSFTVRVICPDGPGPYPVILNGDGCWWYLSDQVAKRVLESGCALVIFNRTEMAGDLGTSNNPESQLREGGLYDVYPDQTFGALSAWAWGYHRCVDLIQELPFLRKDQIAVTGHSRGGKTTLLAGATDDRITLINENASGAGGSASFRYVGEGGETLNILNVFPNWFGDGMRPYLDREDEIPFDQHCLLATLAPRPLLLTYALDDRWSNPEGMVLLSSAVRKVYRFLGAEDNLAFHLRPGTHAHTLDDWEVLLDFIHVHWFGENSTILYNQHPYTHLRPLDT
jgi:hypothetical protein